MTKELILYLFKEIEAGKLTAGKAMQKLDEADAAELKKARRESAVWDVVAAIVGGLIVVMFAIYFITQ